MAITRVRRSATLALCCTAGLTVQVAQADVVIEERISVQGSGLMSFANMSGHTVTSISGDKARMENDIQMHSRVARMFARGAEDTTQIIRLGEDKVYDLNDKKKQYTETSLAEMRAQMQKAMEQTQQAQQQQPAPTGMNESDCEWSEPKLDVKKTGAKGTFAGFSAEQHTIVASQSCKDRKTGAVCDIALVLDQWIAPGFEGSAEALSFHQAFAQKLGFDASASQDFARRAESMFSRYPGMWKQVADKMASVKGYPVKSMMAMGVGGPQCQNTQTAQGDPEAGTSSPSSSSPPTSIGGVAGEIGGRIAGSIFGRKKQADAQNTSAADSEPLPAALNGLVTPLRITSELVSIRKDAVAADAFEVPAGFKKVSN
jgi:hypothetical protein